MKRALIVDDIAQNLYLLRVLLQGSGYLVDEARQGAEALEKARQAPPDLIVSDLLMPVMDGYTLLRHWKADETLRHIPFVVYTATFTDPKDESLALALGADAFIVKPAEPDTFMACIDALIARVGRGERPLPAATAFDQQGLLADYNEALIRKLEKRAQQLEASNRDLQQALAEGERTKAALQESEERFRATFEHAAVGIAHVGIDGRFLRVNDKLCEITAYPRAELLNLGLAALWESNDGAECADAQAAMLAGTRTVHSLETRFRRKDGSLIWANFVANLLLDRNARPQYFIAVVADITERKLLEEQFRQVQKVESIGQLTGGIAHDFNNLLTVIIGNADLLAERLAADRDLAPLAEMTGQAARRGADLTRRLLAFARRQALDPRAVDVNELLRGMQALLKRMLPESIDIRFEHGTDLWPALVDPAQLESAILNLAINARDAMPTGGHLTLATTNLCVAGELCRQIELSLGDYVRITVSDTGTGIAHEHLAHVFEPFFTTKPTGSGTGLGLSMVHGFIKQSRGSVTVHSEPGHGATIDLYLPRALRADAPLEARAPDAIDPRGSERILLVEDDDLVRQLAERHLLALGYRVISVADGAAAMAVIRTTADIDLLFTDVVMPGGINGRQLADAALVVKPGLKLLFSSGYTEDAALQLGVHAHRPHLLRKPYDRDELARKLRVVLSEPVPARPAASVEPGPQTLLILDDDPTVALILARAAETLGFRALSASTPQAFFDHLAQSWPSYVAIDLSMPEMHGTQILEHLARLGCTARVIISSGADAGQLDAAVDHGRRLRLDVAGALAKPFPVRALVDLLMPLATT